MEESPSAENFLKFADVALTLPTTSTVQEKSGGESTTLVTSVSLFSAPVYQIQTTSGTDTEYLVHRSLEDFEWLRKQLADDHPLSVIPPIAYHPSAARNHTLGLDKFLKRVTAHPVLSASPRLQQFLTAKTWEMPGVSSWGVLASKLHTQLSTVELSSPEQTDLAAAWDYLTMLGPSLQELHQFVLLLDSRIKEYHTTFHQQRQHYVLWANSESGEMKSVLLGSARSMDLIDLVLEEMVNTFFREHDFPFFELKLFAQEIKANLGRYKRWEEGSHSVKGHARTWLAKVLGNGREPSDHPDPLIAMRAEVDFSLDTLNTDLRTLLASLARTKAQLATQCQKSYELANEEGMPKLPDNFAEASMPLAAST